jgi:hypothetical protein
MAGFPFLLHFHISAIRRTTTLPAPSYPPPPNMVVGPLSALCGRARP